MKQSGLIDAYDSFLANIRKEGVPNLAKIPENKT